MNEESFSVEINGKPIQVEMLGIEVIIEINKKPIQIEIL